jgi:hypothetical protein
MTKDLRECIGTIIVFLVPLMIIHLRGVSMMSGAFQNRYGNTLKGLMTYKMVLVY